MPEVTLVSGIMTFKEVTEVSEFPGVLGITSLPGVTTALLVDEVPGVRSSTHL